MLTSRSIQAEQLVVDGTVEGPVQGGSVVLKSQAHVVGDIRHHSLAIESGAFFDGRSVQNWEMANARKFVKE